MPNLDPDPSAEDDGERDKKHVMQLSPLLHVDWLTI